jgi:diguanylate cyclase
VRNALLVKAHHDYLKHYAKELERQTRQLEAQIAQARTDALTGLANRRALDEEIGRQYALCLRTGSPLSVMLLDVDKFKLFNDTHGHRAGDEALRVVAGILRNAMRQMDIVTRYGGEEFLVMMPGTTLEGARMVAERTRQDIGKTRFRYDGKNFSLTVSVGVAQLAGHEHVTQMLQRCDQAMYAAKQAGRNLTFWHDGRAAHDVADEVMVEHAVNSVPPTLHPDRAPPTLAVASPDSSNLAMATLENLASASQASFDSLGVHCDRSAFYWQIHQRIAEWKRGGHAFCLMLARVVRKEASNEASGETKDGEPAPAAVDDAVRMTARILSTVVREMDMIGRYDSHGLCLLLPRTTVEQGAIVAQRVRRYIQANEPGMSLMPAQFGFSFGVVEVCEGDDPVRLFQRAEAAMEETAPIH